MSASKSWKLPAMAGLVGLALASSVAGLTALAAQAGPLMAGRTLGFAEAHDRRAFRILEGKKTSAALRTAADEAGKALALSPYSNPARLRLAYVEAQRDGSLKADGLKRLAESYDLVPFDHTIGGWRIAFALEHWNVLTPELRTAVQAEALAFGRMNSQDVNVRQALQGVHNPEGRVAAALWLQALKQ